MIITMSNSRGNRRIKHPSTRKHHEDDRKLSRSSVKKCLVFDDAEENEERQEAFSHHTLHASASQQIPKIPIEGETTVLRSFWTNPPPPPPLAPNSSEKTINRRSLRLRAKNQFPFSQIADRLSPKLVVNATPNPVSLGFGRKQTDFSDYGTSSECSAFYYQPNSASQSSCSSLIANTKACFDTVAEKKCTKNMQNNTDAGNQSLGYSSDLDDVMSNLSIDDGHARPTELRRWDSDEDFLNENDNGKDSHVSLNDLKLDGLKVSLKEHEDIRVLTPLQGFEISHPQKYRGHRAATVTPTSNYRTKTPNVFRYDLRKRPGCLENTISIDTFDVSIEDDFLKAGLRIFQVSPIISIQPHEIKFCSLWPAIVQIPLNLDLSPGDEVHCLFSQSGVDDVATNYSNISWSSEMAGRCSINDGKVNFETFQFGLFVIIVRPKCPYSSSEKNIRARVGGKLKVSDFPNVEVSFPKEVTELEILRANAKIYFDTEESVSDFIAHRCTGAGLKDSMKETTTDCLATPIIQLEPHGINFESEPVLITLPVPDYDRIVARFGCKAKLSIWQSNTHSREPSNKGVWDAISEYLCNAKMGMLYYFVSFAMKCQANMQEYPDQVASANSSKASNKDVEASDDNNDDKSTKPIKGGSRFGLEVTIFQADKPWPQMSTYTYKVGQSNPKLVKPGKICVRLKSLYFEPDIQAGEEEEMLKEESDFRGRDFEKQFICKFKPDVNIERGPFGKVLVTRHVSPRQKGQPIFEFNIQKRGNEGEFEDSSAAQNEEWSMVALTELASSLFVTEGDNWKLFALEIGMTKQEIKDAKLKSESQPFQKIVSHYRQRRGTVQELMDALYRCHRKLKVGGQYSAQGSTHTLSSNGSSGRGSLSSNNAHFSRIGSHDSDTSGTQTSQDSRLTQDSGLPPGRKRSLNSSYRGSGAGVASVQSKHSKLSKRRRLEPVASPSSSSKSKLVDPSEADDEELSSSSESESGKNAAGSIVSNLAIKKDHITLESSALWEISEQLIKANWRALGRTLGVNENELIEIDNTYGRNIRESSFQTLLTWKSMFPKKCTVGNLHAALQKEKMIDAATKLYKIDFSSSSD